MKFTNPSTTQRPGDSESIDPSVRSAACCDCESFWPLQRTGRSAPSMPARVLGRQVPVPLTLKPWEKDNHRYRVRVKTPASNLQPLKATEDMNIMNTAICDFQGIGGATVPSPLFSMMPGMSGNPWPSLPLPPQNSSSLRNAFGFRL